MIDPRDSNPVATYTFPSITISALDDTPPNLTINGAPQDWQNTPANATITCDDGNGSGCDTNTISSQSFAESPTTCPTDPSGYTNSTSINDITTHQWICARAEDNSGNIGVSDPIEFRVDQIDPICGTNWTPSTPDANGNISITLSGSTDTGGSGINQGGGICNISASISTCDIEISDNAGNTTTCTSPAQDTPICSLSATSDSINPGESIILTWNTTNATLITIDPNIGPIAPSSSPTSPLQISPTTTTSYTLTADGPGGSCNASVTITVNTPPPPPTSEGKCTLSWGGIWAGIPDGSGGTDPNIGTCFNITSLASAPDFGASPILCQSFRMTASNTGEGILDANPHPCKINIDEAPTPPQPSLGQPVWDKSNFDILTDSDNNITGYQRNGSATNATRHDAPQSPPSDCSSLDSYVPNSTSLPPAGDYCIPFGQRLLGADQINYNTTAAQDFFANCNHTDTNCACPDLSLPLGTDFNANSTSGFSGRVDDEVELQFAGQCLDQKIVQCLYLPNADNTYYFLDNGTPRCSIPSDSGNPTLHYWDTAQNIWIPDADTGTGNTRCSDGEKKNDSGECVACSASDEGSPECCNDDYSWWNQSDNTCLRPERYECERIMTGATTPLSGLYDGYPLTNIPNAQYQQTATSHLCTLSCSNAVERQLRTNLPINSQWTSGIFSLRLSRSQPPFLPFDESGISSSAVQDTCNWECTSGYIPNSDGTGCEPDDDQNVTLPGDGTPPVEGEDPPDLPQAPLSNVTNSSAVSTRTSDIWTGTSSSGIPYFLSPLKDGTINDVALRFRVPDNIIGWPSGQDIEILRWEIQGFALDGTPRRLTSLSGCFDGGNEVVSSNLCMSHFYDSESFGGNYIRLSSVDVIFKNLVGRDSLDGTQKTMTTFLNDPDLMFPSLSLSMISDVRDTGNTGSIIARHIDYQVLVSSPSSSQASLPGGPINLVRTNATISGLKTQQTIRVNRMQEIPSIRYTIFGQQD